MGVIVGEHDELYQKSVGDEVDLSTGGEDVDKIVMVAEIDPRRVGDKIFKLWGEEWISFAEDLDMDPCVRDKIEKRLLELWIGKALAHGTFRVFEAFMRNMINRAKYNKCSYMVTDDLELLECYVCSDKKELDMVAKTKYVGDGYRVILTNGKLVKTPGDKMCCFMIDKNKI